MRKTICFLIFLCFICGCAPAGPYANIKNVHEAAGDSIVCLGDSITAGAGAAAGQDYPSLLKSAVKLPVVNAGVSGDTTQGALQRIAGVLSHRPKIVIVELGGNDYLRGVSVSETFNNLRQIIEKIQQEKAVVILIDLPLGPAYEEEYKNLARDRGCLLIEGLMREVFDDRSLMADEMHPNSIGYQKMADKIGETVNALLLEMTP